MNIQAIKSGVGRIGGGALTLIPAGLVLAQEAEELAEESAAGTNNFLVQWNPGEFIWALLFFILLLTILIKFAWPHILKGLQDRDNKIRQDLKQAEQARAEAEASMAEYKRQLAEARKEAQALIEQSRVEAERAAAEVRAQSQRDLAQLKHRAEQDIAAAREQAVNELFEQAATLATEVAGQILKREINAEDQQALVDQSLSRLSGMQRA